jgi:hypothetical protein
MVAASLSTAPFFVLIVMVYSVSGIKPFRVVRVVPLGTEGGSTLAPLVVGLMEISYVWNVPVVTAPQDMVSIVVVVIGTLRLILVGSTPAGPE